MELRSTTSTIQEVVLSLPLVISSFVILGGIGAWVVVAGPVVTAARFPDVCSDLLFARSVLSLAGIR